MGSSPSAYLMYGYVLGGGQADWNIEGYDEEEYSMSWPEWMTQRAATTGTDELEDYDPEEGPEYLSSSDVATLLTERLKLLRPDYFTKQVERWYEVPEGPERERLRALRDRGTAEVGVTVDQIGFEGTELALVTHETHVHDYGYRHLDLAEWEARRWRDHWDDKLARAVECLQITPKEAPGWFLTASYG